ncbi:MAG TPA: preprotein translocase subunit SecA, partial [bacterium]|nr:preprotein translocase subunit SecA [bacterium]
MFGSIFDTNEKQLKKIWPIVGNVNSFEESVKNLSREEMVEKTKKWKEELKNIGDQEIEKRLGEILPEAYALVRESSSRTLKMRHYDVQILAGIILHQGKIAEQKTGEGKTLTATLPLYLNSLTGRGVHLVTPNDYLSRHGAGWMGPIYDYLGVSVGVIVQDRAFVYDPSYQSTEFEDSYSVHLREVSRQEAYKCDIVYGTNHEFGFDYLRDNMVRSLSQMVQTNPNGDWGVHSFAIVDEVDSILIDMARTPLIISAADAKPSERYHQANEIIKSLIKDTDYEIEEKYKNVTLTDLGIRRVERLLGVNNLYEQDFEMVHLIEQALLANTLYEKDRDYVVKNGAVIIVDQFTGRLLPNNRFSNGLHQAIEAKEGVTIQQESKTLAEISYQNYFRMYKKLAGMTGTAATESEEFFKIYKLEVLVVPTNKPCIRKDDNDVVYKTEAAKFKAVVDEIEERHKKGQPVLVGTTSVEKSELLHRFLQKRNITHEILNAKNHEREALIIAQAGREGAVTISTNMAGRGVDIILGGDPPDVEMQKRVIESGGLFVVGTERHESRRIDNQLRGRSGRQGDPGESKFFVSLQDDLMRI